MAFYSFLSSFDQFSLLLEKRDGTIFFSRCRV
jgi:hypothetical protein